MKYKHYTEFKERNGKRICPECNKEFSKYGIINHYYRNHTLEGNQKMEKLSLLNKEKIQNGLGKGFASKEYQEYMKTDKYKEEQSERMLQVVKDNPDSYSANNVCGRNKKVTYNNESYQSTWEVIVAKYFDMFQIPFERIVEPIEYYWDGKIRNYFPDFYIRQWDIYIEVKGYETERDRAKWSALDNLIVLKDKEITHFEKMIKKCPYSQKERQLPAKQLLRYRNSLGAPKKAVLV